MLTRGSDDRIDACLSVRDGRLYIEDCDATELARRFGTPLFVVSEDQLRRNVRRFTDAFAQRWPEGKFRLLPAVKANTVVALWRILQEEGTGADTFGPAEFEVVRRAGIDPASVSVNGSKHAAFIEDVVRAGARITIDNLAEIGEVRRAAERVGAEARIRFRVRPDLTAIQEPSDFSMTGQPIGARSEAYRPGVPMEQLVAFDLADLGDHIKAIGVHLHVGRGSSNLAVRESVARAMVEAIDELREAWAGWTPSEIDLGGGLPTPRDPVGMTLESVAARRAPGELAPPVEDYADVYTQTLRDECGRRGIPLEGVTLEVEPGRSLFGDVGIHLATIRRLKEQSRPVPYAWVETDTTEMFVTGGMWENSRWNVVVANRADEPLNRRVDVAGCSCNFDQMVADAEIPQVVPGDIISFLDTGAYEETTASNFNALPRPGTVLVSGETAELVRRPEVIDDVFRRDVIPERLTV